MADAPHHLSIIGYWAERGAPPDRSRGWPDPHDLVGSWERDDRVATVRHLAAGKVFRSFAGRSTCRVCGEPLGSTELTDGTWAWPEHLEHYVETHAIMLPDAFVSTCGSAFEPPPWLDACTPEQWVQAGSETSVPVLGQGKSAWVVDDAHWLDWAATKTPARPRADAVSLEEACAVCARLSHRAWRASIVELAGRWRLECGSETRHDRLYLERCSAAMLERRLLACRMADPDAILSVPRANQIAAQYDGDWGALRVLAAQPAAWVLWTKPAAAAWPTKDRLDELLNGPMAFGWTAFHPGGQRSYVIVAQDEPNWRHLLEHERATSRTAPSGPDRDPPAS